jgi:hypothetical protein
LPEIRGDVPSPDRCQTTVKAVEPGLTDPEQKEK